MRSIAFVNLAVVGALLTGCATGSWKLESISPEGASKHYALADFTLYDDGTYTALIDVGQGPHPSNGRYTFTGGKLTFSPDDGEPRTYDAELIVLGHKMRVVGVDPKGNRVTAIMVRK
jgi:hypothetical protein